MDGVDIYVRADKHLATHNVSVIFWATLFGSSNFLEPIMILLYLQTGFTMSDVYLVTLIWCISAFLFEVPTGAFADRFGPKVAFVTGSLVSLASKGALLCAVLFQESGFFYVYNIFWAISVTFFSGAEEALVYESLKESGKENTMDDVLGKLQSAGFYPTIFTFLAGAYLAKDLRPSQFLLLILLGIGFQLLQLVFLCRVINPAVFDTFRHNPFQHVRNGIRNIRNEPRLVRLFLHFTIIFVVCVNVFGETEQPYLTGAGLPVEWLGVLYASMSVIGLLVSRYIGWLTKHVSRVFVLVSTGCICCLAFLVASIWVGSLWIAILVFVTLRLTRMVRYPVYSHLQNEYIPSESRATTLSILSLGDSFFDVVLLLCFANIADFGISAIALGCALAVLVGVLIPIRAAAKREIPIN